MRVKLFLFGVLVTLALVLEGCGDIDIGVIGGHRWAVHDMERPLPEVVKAVEHAKTSVDRQRLEDAGPQMLEILKQLQGDSTVKMLDGIVAGARGADVEAGV